jgi:hypothetical protein
MTDLPPKERMCHLTGFTQSCRKLVTDEACSRWMQIQGHHPNTGEPINQSKCIDDWMPILMMENSQMQRQTGAAVESFRNEVLAANGYPKGVNPASRMEFFPPDRAAPRLANPPEDIAAIMIEKSRTGQDN